MDYVTQRRQDLIKGFKKDSIDAFLVTDPVNVTYLSGFTGSSGYLVVTAKSFILVTDTRYEEQVKEECPGLDVHIRGHDKTTPEAAAEILTKSGAKAVGLEADHATLALVEFLKEKANRCTFVPVGGAIQALRAVKDPSEVEQIRAAIKVAERAFTMFKATLREADTEKDMVDALEGYIRRAGAKSSAFSPIVAAGERGALPHAKPTNLQLGEVSKLLVDWGADIVGYKSDLTRCFRSPFPLAPTRRNKSERTDYNFEELHQVALQAQEAAAAVCRDGVSAKDVDAAARKVIQKAGYGDYFTHGLGHGFGLEIHELPRVRANSPDVLATGNVITLEPGIYLPGWGGVRVEDDFLVTKDGLIRLTTLPHDPGIIG